MNMFVDEIAKSYSFCAAGDGENVDEACELPNLITSGQRRTQPIYIELAAIRKSQDQPHCCLIHNPRQIHVY